MVAAKRRRGPATAVARLRVPTEPGTPENRPQIVFTPGRQRAKLDFMSGDAQLMLMIAGMHLLGLACAAVLILPALRDSPEYPSSPSRPRFGRWLGPRA